MQYTIFGHVCYKETATLARSCIPNGIREVTTEDAVFMVQHKRPRGAPQFTYGRGIYKALRKLKIALDNWPMLAMDRVAWRDMLTVIDL